MKKYLILILSFGLLSICTPYPAQADWKEFLKSVQDELTAGGGLSEGDITRGLKQALEIGTKNVVKLVSQLDGYYKNPKIRIPLPKKMRKTAKHLRKIGLGSKIDEFEKSMNRAAEKAAPKARKIFWDAIKQMRISDAKKILNGRNNEATLFFKEKTYGPLEEVFKPIVNKAMKKVGVTRHYKDINSTIKTIPFLSAYHFDLDQYVTRKALDGLFYMIAKEEYKIRKDPKARVTKLLRKVFGGNH